MAPGLSGPVPDRPRRPGTVRRTSTIHSSHPEGIDGPTVLVGRARDLRTDERGTEVLDEVELRGQLTNRTLRLASLESTPASDLVAALVPSVVVAGFRKTLRLWPPAEVERHRLLFSLLDDLPGAALVSGYAVARCSDSSPPFDRAQFVPRLDVCAGWATGASMDQLSIAEQVVPLPVGVPLPVFDQPVDPLAWHAYDQPGPVEMLRRRVIDLAPRAGADGVEIQLNAHFRDVFCDLDGQAAAVHEYSVELGVQPRTGEVTRVDAQAHVLPWRECPSALASARQAVGRPLADLRGKLGGAFVGTTSCTHLNDTMRSLGHADGLWRTLAP